MFGQTDWLNLLQTFGLAVVILFAIGIAAWRSAVWFSREIVLPVRDRMLDRFIAFLGKIEGTVDKLNGNVDAITSNLDKQTHALESIEVLGTTSLTATKATLESSNRKEDKIDSLSLEQKKSLTDLAADVKEVKVDLKAALHKIDEIAEKK